MWQVHHMQPFHQVMSNKFWILHAWFIELVIHQLMCMFYFERTLGLMPRIILSKSIPAQVPQHDGLIYTFIDLIHTQWFLITKSIFLFLCFLNNKKLMNEIEHICDMIKGNESHVEDFQFWVFDTIIWQLQNATFWCQSHKNWIFGLQSYEQDINTENNIKQRHLTSFFANISKPICSDIRLIPLDHVTYSCRNKWMHPSST